MCVCCMSFVNYIFKSSIIVVVVIILLHLPVQTCLLYANYIVTFFIIRFLRCSGKFFVLCSSHS